MTKHTRGRWAYTAKLSGSENHRGFRLFDSNGNWLADISPRDEDGSEGEANARLIAAAPDLLARLKTLLGDMDHEANTTHFNECWYDTDRAEARAAIGDAEEGGKA